MPEGPEVKHFFDKIKFIKNKELESIILLDDNPRYHIPKLKLPTKITNCGVKGKTIWWTLEEGHSILFTHGMSGYWMFKEDKYNRIEFTVENKNIYFNDVRKFAHIKVVKNVEEELDKLGPSVLDKPSYEDFYKRFKNKNTEISKILLQQEVIAGIGNYLRAEILWKSKISPYRKYQSLTENEKKELYKNALELTEYHYTHPDDFNFNVYDQEKDPYGNPVTKDKFNGRTLHWVKQIQV